MGKKLSCCCIALIVIAATVLVGTGVGLAVYFACFHGKEEDDGGHKNARNDGERAVDWQGGPQNEVKGFAEMLGTEFIEYRRSPDQYKKEANYASSKDGNGKTSSSLQPFPLKFETAKLKGNKVYAKMNLDAAVRRASDEKGNTGGAKLRFFTGRGLLKGQNLAHAMATSGNGAKVAGTPVKASEIALVVAGNSGLPGGGTSSINPKIGAFAKFRLNLAKMHNGHKTQEESVVSNWYVHQVRELPTNFASTKFGKKKGLSEAGMKAIKLYVKTLQGKWGLKSANAGDYETYQGVDYVHTKNPIAFADSWVVRNPQIGQEYSKPELFHNEDQDPTKLHMASATYPGMQTGGIRLGALLFVAAPNAHQESKGANGSCTRTLNKYGKYNFNFFLAGLQAAVTAAIDAAIQEQLLYGKEVKVLIFNKLGGGLYWPRDKKGNKLGGGATKANYSKVFEAALAETVEVDNVGPEGRMLSLPKRAFFDDIVLTHDDKP